MLKLLPNTANQACAFEMTEILVNNMAGTFDAIFFDPQYAGTAGRLKISNLEARQKKRAELNGLNNMAILKLTNNFYQLLKPSGYLFHWMDKQDFINGSWIGTDLMPSVDGIVWDKQRMGMGYRTRNHFEALRISQKAPKQTKNWNNKGIRDVWREKAKKGRDDHPHKKPIGLIRTLIECVSEPQGIIGDFCAGSFVVLDACKELNRTFYGCDLSTKYYKEKLL